MGICPRCSGEAKWDLSAERWRCTLCWSWLGTGEVPVPEDGQYSLAYVKAVDRTPHEMRTIRKQWFVFIVVLLVVGIAAAYGMAVAFF